MQYCIALSSGLALDGAEPASAFVPTKETESWNVIHRTLVPRRHWHVVNVMMIEWRGEIAERVAIGKVMELAWTQNWNKKWMLLG